MNKTQKGFAALEGLLILIIIAIIGGTGWYVWHSKNQTDNTLDRAASQETTASNKKESTNATESAPGQKYLVITQWGVKAKNPQGLTLEYKIDKNTAVFTSKELVSASGGKSCDGGSIWRVLPTDMVPFEGPPDEVTAQQYIDDTKNDSSFSQNYSKLGQYYYIYRGEQGACSDGSEIQNLQSQTEQAVADLLKSLVAN
ncbi:MAG TPA: hypothetical protein VFW90_02335 [Candidatus Saccharimonadales bacterium]|nr:hypothetical protein [Candidatus Saccharimonadales bacterium]